MIEFNIVRYNLHNSNRNNIIEKNIFTLVGYKCFSCKISQVHLFLVECKKNVRSNISICMLQLNAFDRKMFLDYYQSSFMWT